MGLFAVASVAAGFAPAAKTAELALMPLTLSPAALAACSLPAAIGF